MKPEMNFYIRNTIKGM